MTKYNATKFRNGLMSGSDKAKLDELNPALTAKASLEQIADLEPTLDLNFTSSSLDSRITFTRNSVGSYFGYDGIMRYAAVDTARVDYDPVTNERKGLLIEEARTNLLNQTEQFSDSSWIKTFTNIALNAEIAPDGSLTASKLIETASNNTHVAGKFASTATKNVVNTFSVFAKAGERSKFSLIINAYSGNGVRAVFDLSKEIVISALNVGSGSGATASIQPVGNGWYKCVLTGIPSSTATTGVDVNIELCDDSGNFAAYTGDGKSGIYIWGAQLEAGSFPTSYVPSAQTFTSRASSATYYDLNGILQTATTNTARISYNPSPDKLHLAPKLLLEPQATNNFLQSENLAASWGLTRATQSSSTQATPDGNTSSKAIVLTNNGTTGTTSAFQSMSVTAGVAYTISSYVKIPTSGTPFNGEAFHIDFGEPSGANEAKFNLLTGVVTVQGTCVSGAIQALPNGWYRISSTFIPTETESRNISPYAFASPTGGLVMWCWGAQLEEGYAPTSYIPTTTATVTRSADFYTSASVQRQRDEASMTGSNFTSWYRFDEGTVYCDGSYFDKGGANPLVPITTFLQTSSTGLGFEANSFSGGLRFRSRVSTVSDVQATAGAVPSDFKFKLAGAYSGLTATSACLNGATPVTSNVPTAVPTPATLYIGSYALGGAPSITDTLNGHIKRLTFWPKRLDNNTIQTITALP